MQHFSHHRHGLRASAWQPPKKTPATMPASEYSFKKDKPFFEENAALPERIGRGGVCRSERLDLLLSIQFGFTLSWPTVFLVSVHVCSGQGISRIPLLARDR